jgi:predicted membrane protein
MRGRIVVGIILTLLGIVLVGDRLRYWVFGDIVSTYWPMILIVLGLAMLLSRSGVLGPLILIAIGVVFQVDRLGRLPEDWGRFVVPIGVLLIGLWLLIGAIGRGSRPKGTKVVEGSKGDEFSVGSDRHERFEEDTLHRFTLFGGLHTAVMSDRFRGGSATALFGGTVVDLRGAKLVPDAKIDLVAMFGGVDLIVPTDWQIDLRGTPLFGGVENKVPPREGATGPRLIVTATAIFGGVTVRPPGPKDV